MHRYRLAHEFALALLAGPWERQALIDRTEAAFGGRQAWMKNAVQRVLDDMGVFQTPELRRLERFLQQDDGFQLARIKHRLKIVHRFLTPTPMNPKPGAPSTWRPPPLVTEGDICNWLGISHEHLTWLADVHGRERTRAVGPLRQYIYKWVPKRSGGWRLIEIPKSKLKEIQRRILAELLDKVPVHPSAHGFVKNGSIKKFVSPHTNQWIAIRMDLKDFFMSVQASRVHALFRTVGYSESVARILTGFCTNSVPSEAMRLPSTTARLPATREALLRTPHLPQGAPTSPALANLCAYRFDSRVTALVKKMGWTYTRYADDLLLSGPRASSKFLKQIQIWVGAIALEENFDVNMRKTRIMTHGHRQHAGGLVFNEIPNIPRENYDSLKAILYNCVKHGPAMQNREQRADFKAHLQGQISQVVHIHPPRGKRLRTLFDRIEWDAPAASAQ